MLLCELQYKQLQHIRYRQKDTIIIQWFLEENMLNILQMPTFISDDVIELHARINHDYDIDHWHEIHKYRSLLRQYLTWIDKTTSIDDCATTSEMFTKEWKQGKIYAYSIVLKSTQKAIGSIDIHNIDNNNKAELGYWISPSHNSKGFASRAVKLIEKQAFNCGIHRLVIIIQKDNTPSSRVAERNNYILEGVLHDALYKYDRYFDAKIYAKINNS